MTATPQRMLLSRAKSFNLQVASLALNGLPAINVARPGPWGNPFIIGRDGTRDECVHKYRVILSGFVCLSSGASVDSQKAALNYIAAHRRDLRGKNLACWCRLDGKPCHADVLLAVGRCA